MKDKSKLKALLVAIAAFAAIVVAFVMGYHYFGPQKPLPKATMVSIADLVRLEKKDPSALTDDQRTLLATIPEDQKQKLLTRPSFTLANIPPKPAKPK